MGLGIARLNIDGIDMNLASDARLGAGWKDAEESDGRFLWRW